MKLQTAHPMRSRKRPLSLPPSGTADADAAAVCFGAAVCASATPLAAPSRRRIPALLLASIALCIAGRGALLVEAVESPTPYGSDAAASSSVPNSDEKSNNDEKVDVVYERVENMADTTTRQRIIVSEEDSKMSEEDGYGHDLEKDDPPQYEPKALKQQPYPTNRRQRPKHRHIRQKHQQQGQSPHSSQSENDDYMRWCEKVLGIQSIVEIREFEYLDHLQLHWEEKDEESDHLAEFDWLKQYSATKEYDSGMSSEKELPTQMVRGLAAKHDIQVGDTVISIPLFSLLSVPTTIDHDPVLSRILGPHARQKYGWANTAEYEIVLLVIAVLYHRSLGSDSPLSHYIDMLVGTPTDSFPFLWSDRELRQKTGDRGDGVRYLAQGIRQDMYDMYDTVMGTLVKEKPEWFAPPNGYDISGEVEGPEWIYSFDNFRWAFALVISRHHYLPIKDIDYEDELPGPKNRPTPQTAEAPTQTHLSSVSEAVPPANQPTDSWVDEAKNEEHVNEDDLVTTDDDATIPILDILDQRHSFLAPLADLINFGPPCLTGRYNAEDHMFELIATCPFAKGQEVTFYYSSDCSDGIIANFGFLHPLVPPCAAPEDWEKRSDEWEEKAKMREKELWEVVRRNDMLKDELSVMESQLVSCGCEDGEKKEPIYSMPTAGRTAAEDSHLLRNGHHQQHHLLRQDMGVRRRTNDQAEATKEMMEELG